MKQREATISRWGDDRRFRTPAGLFSPFPLDPSTSLPFASFASQKFGNEKFNVKKLQLVKFH